VSPSEAFWISYGFPIVGIIAGVVTTTYLWIKAREFDRRYGRQGRSPAE
jgi:hypothetical protein